MRGHFPHHAFSRRGFCRGLILGGAGLLASAAGPVAGAEVLRADLVLVLKAQRRLLLQRGGRSFAEFRVSLGPNPMGPKIAEGDGRTPEGSYRIDGRDGASRYHRFLHISYPEPRDIARARARGLAPGGGIGIHGLPGDYDLFGPVTFDWTEGCIAVSIRAIDEIWLSVGLGTAVEIRA